MHLMMIMMGVAHTLHEYYLSILETSLSLCSYVYVPGLG